jgi:hypothetical protein
LQTETLLWLTDPHLNFVPPTAVDELGARFRGQGDALVVTGDIGEHDTFGALLSRLAQAAAMPTWFVFGNHDAYGGSIAATRAAARRVPGWLTAAQPIDLGGGTVLVGHDGWYDARSGDPEGSPVELSDFYHIEELRGLTRGERNAQLRRLGDEAAAEAETLLRRALAAGPRRLVFATHVPPWPEACWHEGQISDSAWLPWFTCNAMGDVLARAAAAHPDVAVLVLCGHTHGGGRSRIAPNLEVVTGAARYGAPSLTGRVDTRTLEVRFASRAG